MKSFNLNLLSTYRKELMGASALGILLCHAWNNGVHLPTPFSQILSLGGLGTFMFFFLSGFGLFFSLSKRNVSILRWYKDRFLKLFIPYTIVYAPFLIISVVKGELSILAAILKWSTIGYWIGYGGAWFVDFLVPLYLFAPLCYYIVEKFKNRWIPILLIIFVMIGLGKLFPTFEIAFHKGMVFFIGYWIAPYSKQEKTISWVTIISITLVYTLYSYFGFSILSWSWFKSSFFVTMMLICVIVKSNSFKWLQKVFAFMGGICFESYLFNVSLPGVMRDICFTQYCSSLMENNYIRYLLVVIFGIILSWLFNKLNKVLIKKIV